MRDESLEELELKEQNAKADGTNNLQPSSITIHISNYRRNRTARLAERDQEPIDLEDCPVKKRTFTDIRWLVLLALCIGLMCFAAFRSWARGDPMSLVWGYDSFGNRCNLGANKPITGAPLSGKNMDGRWFRFTINPDEKNIEKRLILCVKQCLSVNITSLQELAAAAVKSGSHYCVYNIETDEYTSVNSSTAQEKCSIIPRSAEVPIGRRCVDKSYEHSATNPHCTSGELGVKETTIMDIMTSIVILLSTAAFSIVVSFVTLLLLIYIPHVTLWMLYTSLLFASLACTGYFWIQADEVFEALWKGEQPQQIGWLVAAILISVFDIFIVCFLLVKKYYVPMSVAYFEEPHSVIRTLPMLLAQPIITLFTVIGSVAGFLYILMLMNTSYDKSIHKDGTVHFSSDAILLIFQFLYVVGLVWVGRVLFACERFNVSYAVARWFFARNKKKVKGSLSKACRQLIVYHLGSMACGTLIVKPCTIPKLIAGACWKCVKSEDTDCTKCLHDCCEPCFVCYIGALQFLTEDGYIFVALYGDNFLRSCVKAKTVTINFSKSSHSGNIVYTRWIAKLLLNTTQLSITILQLVLVFPLVNKEYMICNPAVVLTISSIISAIIAHIFLGFYEQIQDTLYICFCVDACHNNGNSKPYYMSDNMKTFLAESQKTRVKYRKSTTEGSERRSTMSSRASMRKTTADLRQTLDERENRRSSLGEQDQASSNQRRESHQHAILEYFEQQNRQRTVSNAALELQRINDTD